jgi:uncharacterized protein (DUF3084 family)
MYSSKSRERLTAFAIVAIIILLAINAILLYNKYKQDKIISQQQEKINEASRLQSELEKEFYEAMSELEEMRGDNEKMNSVIDQQKAELQEQRDRIDRLINVNQDLQSAKIQLGELRKQVDRYIEQIDQLEMENAVLLDANNRLEEERRLLSDAIANERQTNDELKEEKEDLLERTSKLEKDRTRLVETVTMASAIQAENISISGYKLGSNGDLRKRRKATNIELVEMCFDVAENTITQPGTELYYMRIIDPKGETMAIESLGSGVLEDRSTGEAVRYTQKAEFEYDQSRKRVCMRWQPNTPFVSGTYQYELYNKGYRTGMGSFELK